MKYVITESGAIGMGGNSEYHKNIAAAIPAIEQPAKVVSAGYCKMGEDGKWTVYGNSIGYSMSAKPEDAEKLNTQITKYE